MFTEFTPCEYDAIIRTLTDNGFSYYGGPDLYPTMPRACLEFGPKVTMDKQMVDVYIKKCRSVKSWLKRHCINVVVLKTANLSIRIYHPHVDVHCSEKGIIDDPTPTLTMTAQEYEQKFPQNCFAAE